MKAYQVKITVKGSHPPDLAQMHHPGGNHIFTACSVA